MGCKWSLVQIQSPRPIEAPDLPGVPGTVRGLSFWGSGRWQQIGSKGRLISERDDGSRRSLRERAEVELCDCGAHVLDAVDVRVGRECATTRSFGVGASSRSSFSSQVVRNFRRAVHRHAFAGGGRKCHRAALILSWPEYQLFLTLDEIPTIFHVPSIFWSAAIHELSNDVGSDFPVFLSLTVSSP